MCFQAVIVDEYIKIKIPCNGGTVTLYQISVESFYIQADDKLLVSLRARVAHNENNY